LYIFSNLNFDLLNSEKVFLTEALNWGTPSKRISILLHAVHDIAQVAGPLLSRVTWAFLKLLVSFTNRNV